MRSIGFLNQRIKICIFRLQHLLHAETCIALPFSEINTVPFNAVPVKKSLTSICFTDSCYRKTNKFTINYIYRQHSYMCTSRYGANRGRRGNLKILFICEDTGEICIS